MSLARDYQKSLLHEQGMHAAWLPVANNFEVGSYGWFEGGVMRRIGNIAQDFGIKIGKPKESPGAPFDFESRGVKVIASVGGAEVSSLAGAGDAQAKLTFSFSAAGSVLVRAANVSVHEMPSIQAVANQLAVNDAWDNSYRVVSKVYLAQAAVALVAKEEGTDISFTGKASALDAINSGKGSADARLSWGSKQCFRSVGKTGVIGLGLFKLGWFDRLRLLSGDVAHEVPVDFGNNWHDIDDDV